MRHLVALVALFFVVCGATTIATAAAPEPRVALVIGNSAYQNAPLANPVNDARLMAETLRRLGFDVIERTDATQREMKLAIFELGDRLEAAGKDAVGLFFYAGHGVQVDGQNYLIPLNAEISKERHVAIEAVGASWVLSQMEFAGNRVNFVILDACRNNPLTRGFRSQVRGLAKMNAPTGSLVAYSTGPGDVAADGDDVNSPYTLALSQAMQTPGLPAEKVFKLVRDAVREATNDEQTPWEESSMTGADFYFNVSVAVTVEAPDTPVASDTAAMTQQETVFWGSIEDSTDAADYQAYLSQYPEGAFARLATLRLSTFGQAAAEAERKAAEEAERKAAEEAKRQEAERMAAEEAARQEATRLAAEAEAKRLAAEEAKSKEAKRKAAEEAARATAEAEAERKAADETARKQAERKAAEAAAKRLAAEEAERKAAERKAAQAQAAAAQRQAQERALWDTIKDSNRASDYQVYLQQYPNGTYAALAKVRMAHAKRKAQEEAERKVAKQKALQETQTALLLPPTTASIVVNKAEVEKDDHLKSVIKRYFKKQTFTSLASGGRRIELINFEDLSVKSISGTTFTVDVKYRTGTIGAGASKIERATSKIEKTADSYKVISFDRKR